MNLEFPSIKSCRNLKTNLKKTLKMVCLTFFAEKNVFHLAIKFAIEAHKKLSKLRIYLIKQCTKKLLELEKKDPNFLNWMICEVLFKIIILSKKLMKSAGSTFEQSFTCVMVLAKKTRMYCSFEKLLI